MSDSPEGLPDVITSDPQRNESALEPLDPKTATHGYDGRRRITICGFDIPIVTRTYLAFPFSQLNFIAVSYGPYKGAMYMYMISLPVPFFTELYKQDVTVVNRYRTIATLGFSCKGGFAVLASRVRLAKRNKLAWVSVSVGVIILSNFGVIMMTFLTEHVGNTLGGIILALLLFLFSSGGALLDLLTEGLWSSMLPGKEEFGSGLVSYAWIWCLIFESIGACITGPMDDNHLTKWIPALFIPFTLPLIYPLIANWMMDKPLTQKQHRQKQREGAQELQENLAIMESNREAMSVVSLPKNVHAQKLRRFLVSITPNFYLNLMDYKRVGLHYALERFAVILTILVITDIACSMAWKNNTFNLVVALALGIPIQIMGIISLPAVTGAANLYMFLANATYIGITGVTATFFMAKNLENGPQLSSTIFFTYGGVLHGVAGIIGAVLFGLVFSRHSWWLCFIVSHALRILACSVDVLVTSRANLDIHLSDTLCFLLGDTVMYEATHYLNVMPTMLLISRLCPKGSEALMYATLSGATNAGATIGTNVGSFLTRQFGIVISDSTSTFENIARIPWLVAVAHFFIPVCVLPLVFFLIPSGKIDKRHNKHKEMEERVQKNEEDLLLDVSSLSF